MGDLRYRKRLLVCIGWTTKESLWIYYVLRMFNFLGSFIIVHKSRYCKSLWHPLHHLLRFTVTRVIYRWRHLEHEPRTFRAEELCEGNLKKRRFNYSPIKIKKKLELIFTLVIYLRSLFSWPVRDRHLKTTYRLH